MKSFNKVPVFILAGGLGTRISEETQLKPKPMIEVGGFPVLLHIMRHYYAFGFNDFVICAGYRSWSIKEFFLDYEARCNHIEIDHRTNSESPLRTFGEPKRNESWRVRVIDTGLESMTGARVARAFDFAKQENFEDFAVTYGDGLSGLNLRSEYEFHQSHGKIGTVLGVKPNARFGELETSANGSVKGFLEKPQSKQGLINGGFFFFKRKFRDYLSTDAECILERAPLENLTRDAGLMMHSFDGFWHPMDTLRDKNYLQELWDSSKAPWLFESSEQPTP
jgi:glucose-1-phosphate cytidylyltransferase